MRAPVVTDANTGVLSVHTKLARFLIEPPLAHSSRKYGRRSCSARKTHLPEPILRPWRRMAGNAAGTLYHHEVRLQKRPHRFSQQHFEHVRRQMLYLLAKGFKEVN